MDDNSQLSKVTAPSLTGRAGGESSSLPPAILRRYKQYLLLERGFSGNTLDAYLKDLGKLLDFLKEEGISFREVSLEHLQTFVATLLDLGITTRSIARILAGVRTFYKFLELEKEVVPDPTILLESPSRSGHLPDVLSVQEIDLLIATIDLDKAEGQRDRAILETLYSCGLRVSELCNLKMGDLFLDEGFIRVHGKGKKERLVPISPRAIDELNRWFIDRDSITIRPGHEDAVFVSFRRGTSLSRITIFHLVKTLAAQAGIRSTVSPHTFRHSFATHLLEGGANLRAIQEMLGHEEIGTTEIYMHIDRHHLREEILHHHPRNFPRKTTEN